MLTSYAKILPASYTLGSIVTISENSSQFMQNNGNVCLYFGVRSRHILVVDRFVNHNQLN